MATATVSVPAAEVVPAGTQATVQDVAAELEITTEWLASLSNRLDQGFQNLLVALDSQSQAIQALGSRLSALESRLPESLTQMMESQQNTITRLVREQMETVRVLLTPPAPAPVVVEESPAVVVESPAARTEPTEPARPKRVKL